MIKLKILNRIFEDELFLTKELDGERVIVNATDTFVHVDVNFKEWGLNRPSAHTPEISLKVDEMIYDGTLMDIFTSLPGTRRQKLLTQDQIIETCKTRSGLLESKSTTIFFTEKTWLPAFEWLRIILATCKMLVPQIFAVFVYVSDSGLIAKVYQIRVGLVWNGVKRIRVISPRLRPRFV